MDEADLDEIDHSILHALQKDARHNTNAEIGERAAVSASTVSKRIAQLEARGVIEGYRPEIDYELAGLPLQVLFVCTAPIAEREALVQETLGIDGVVNVREMMTGERNVHILIVGSSNEDITRLARIIDELGFVVNDEVLMRDEYDQPSAQFGAATPTE